MEEEGFQSTPSLKRFSGRNVAEQLISLVLESQDPLVVAKSASYMIEAVAVILALT